MEERRPSKQRHPKKEFRSNPHIGLFQRRTGEENNVEAELAANPFIGTRLHAPRSRARLPAQGLVGILHHEEKSDIISQVTMSTWNCLKPKEYNGVNVEGLCLRTVNCVGEDMMSKCVICLELFESTDLVRVLPCSHNFHPVCIDRWFEISRLCPLCKCEVSLEHNINDVTATMASASLTSLDSPPCDTAHCQSHLTTPPPLMPPSFPDFGRGFHGVTSSGWLNLSALSSDSSTGRDPTCSGWGSGSDSGLGVAPTIPAPARAPLFSHNRAVGIGSGSESGDGSEPGAIGRATAARGGAAEAAMDWLSDSESSESGGLAAAAAATAVLPYACRESAPETGVLTRGGLHVTAPERGGAAAAGARRRSRSVGGSGGGGLQSLAQAFSRSSTRWVSAGVGPAAAGQGRAGSAWVEAPAPSRTSAVLGGVFGSAPTASVGVALGRNSGRVPWQFGGLSERLQRRDIDSVSAVARESSRAVRDAEVGLARGAGPGMGGCRDSRWRGERSPGRLREAILVF